MKTIAKILLLLLLNASGALMVGLQGLFDVQSIMDPVGIILNNPSAKISIIGSYGGVNVVFGLFYIYAAFKAQKMGLLLYSLYVGGFVLGRLMGFIQLGVGNSFVMTWFVVESVFMSLALFLFFKLED